MNSYFGSFSGLIIRPAKSVADLTDYNKEQTKQKDFSSLPKNAKHTSKFRSAFDLTTQSLDFRTTLKKKVTIFSTLLRPRHNFMKQKATQASTETIYFSSDNETSQDKCYGSTLDELIGRLVPTKSYIPEKKLTYTLLLCCRLYIIPVQLLQKLTTLIQKQIEENKEDEKTISKHFVLLLSDWSTFFPLDFKDKLFMKQFNKTCTICLTSNLDVSTTINQISNKLVARFQNILQYIDQSKQYVISLDDDEIDLFEMCKNPMVFAKQLTVIELNKIAKIHSEQLLEKFVAEDVTCSRLDLSTSQVSAVEIYVSWFNRLSHLLATLICECRERKDRVKLVNFFIEVGKSCLKIGNFNSAMAVVTGLNMNPILRMRKTWSNSNQSCFKKLENEFSPKFNFFKYREKLLKKTEKKKDKYIIIPVFSLFIKDLFFINEGLKHSKSMGNVDFKKLLEISKKVKQFEKYRKQAVSFEKNEAIIGFIENTPICNEDILYKKSFDVEPPTSNFERDRYKSVRVRIEKSR